MKRVTLEIDLNDNEVFEKTVKQAVEGMAKQLVREQFDLIMKEESEKLISKRLDDMSKNWYGGEDRLQIMIRSEVKKMVDKVIVDAEINEVIKNQMDIKFKEANEFMEYAIQKSFDSVYNRLYSTIEKKVEEQVPAKIMQVIREVFKEEK